jgi:hypothetical protein
MHSFKDTSGAEWKLELTVGSIKRVRDEVKVNLADDVFTGLLDKLAGDTLLLCDVVWSLIKPQAQALDVDVEKWCNRMGGDALDKASKALLDELIDFSPPPRRGLLKQIMAKALEMQDKSIAEATRVISDGTLDRALLGTTGSVSDTPASSV